MMLNPRRISATHRDVFIARYERLRAWALQMTSGDAALAEDLLHDSFILFTLNQPPLDRIEDVDRYLYTMLRNLHLSQLRRTTRHRFEQLSIVDYESAASSLRRTARDQINAQDELRRVCRYACARKETATAASILILRFFHGYYPSEIAQILHSTRRAVDERLRMARTEAKACIDNPKSPKSLSFIGEHSVPEIFPASFARATDDFLLELRQTIFESRRGVCLPSQQLKEAYSGSATKSMECKELAHIVSCPHCLDGINKLLGLPMLAERYPTDTMGKDAGMKGGSGGASIGGTAASPHKAVAKWERDAREAFEHKPQELCVSVNGYLLGSQKIGSELSELTLSLKDEERISFLEVFSEQGIRLLMMSVDELPPGGPDERTARVELSDTRTLESVLRFGSPWPTLHVTYHDPALKAEVAARLDSVDGTAPLVPLTKSQAKKVEKWREWLLSFVDPLRQQHFNPRIWLRPGGVTTIFAIILITALLVAYLRVTPTTVSAAELLHRSIAAEEVIAGNPEQVLHHTFNLEERQVSGGSVFARRRVEIWQSAAHRLKAVRVYDEQNRLMAGEWTRTNDLQRTLYRKGSPPQIETGVEHRKDMPLLSADSVWQLEPSAKTFTTLVGRADNVDVEEQATAYVINYKDELAPSGLVKATLVIGKIDLRAIKQTLVVKHEGGLREYRFTEARFEHNPVDTVAPSVFEPEPELLGSTVKPSTTAEARTVAKEKPSPPPTPQPLPSASVAVSIAATVEQEVEVLHLLSEAKADLGEQISVTRNAGSQLYVQGIVETEERKAELLRALAPVMSSPAVKVSVSTVAEVVKAEQRAEQAVKPIIKRRIEIEGEQTDEQVRRLANQMLGRSSQAMQHAWALKSLGERFSTEQLRRLSPEGRAKWRELIRTHARAIGRETQWLRQQLKSAASSASSFDGSKRTTAITDDAQLMQAVKHLFEASAAINKGVRAAFTTSTETSKELTINSPEFWRALIDAEHLATAIERAPQQQ